jgi:GTP cyclohydrolase II
VAAHMLMSLNVRSVRLMTNNPNKVHQLEHHGIRVAGRIPHVMPANEHNRFYLETKATRSGHHIELGGQPRLLEQDEQVLVQGMDEESAQ